MKKSLIIATTAVMAIGAGCAVSQKARDVKTRGFLKNYSQLEKGKEDQAHYVYINKNVNFKKYTKIYFKPIEVWKSKDSDLNEIKKADIQALVNYFTASITRELKGEYKFVDKPGPGVMTLRLALTDAKGSNVPMDIIGHIVPIGLGVSIIKKVATGAHSFVGKAGVEGELLDSESGKRLAAFVDERVGALNYTDMGRKWSDTQDSFDYWAKLLRKRLDEMKKR